MPRPQTVTLPLGYTRAAFHPNSIDAEKRTAELVWTTGARVRRYSFWGDGEWIEELSLEDDAVDLRRLRNGANLLAAHDSWGLKGIIGVVEDARLEGANGDRRGVARVRFSERADVEPIFGDVKAGIIRHVSVGYIIHKLEEVDPGNKRDEEPPVYRATRWEPVEVSLVAVPADAGAGVRSARAADQESAQFPCVLMRRAQSMPTATKERPLTKRTPARAEERPPGSAPDEPTPEQPDEGEDKGEGEGTEVPPPAPGKSAADASAEEAARGAERTRVQDIRQAVRNAGLLEAFADKFITDGTSAADTRTAVLAELARTQPPVSRSVVEVVGVGAERLRAGVQNVLLHRIDPSRHALTDDGRQWTGKGLMEIASRLLEARGVRTWGMGRMELAAVALGLAHPPSVREGPHGFLATSDFAAILATVGRLTLTQGYTTAPRTFPPWTRQGTLPDFRTSGRVSLGTGPKLLKVPEHAEYTRGPLGAEVEPIRLETWGRILAFTRQAMINDDIGLFTRIPQLFGNSAAAMESDVVYGILLGNPTLSDGQPLFSAAHGNLMPAGPIDLANVAAARQAMMNQKTPQGQFITVIPRYLIVGPQQEVYAAQFLVPITIVGSASQVTPRTFQSLELVVEPRITDLSWYLSADPAQIDTIEYAYLEGAAGGGPTLETREGWDIDGQEYKAREEFGAAAIDWRGLVKNPGALPTTP